MHANSNRLMIVDGDSITRRHVRQLAEELDYIVEEARTVADAQNIAREFRPSLIILDLHLPDADGIDMLSELEDAGCTAAILILSHVGRAIMDTAKSIADDRGWQLLGCITKPVYPPELAGWLKIALASGPSISPKLLRTAIENDEFVLHFQPTLHRKDDTSWQITGVSGYVRWMHPDFGLLRPTVFLASIEKAGLLSELTDKLMLQAIRDAQFWRKRGLSLTVGFCIPWDLLKNSRLPNRLEELTSEHDVDPTMLVLNILNVDGRSNLIVVQDALIRLRVRGFHLAYDGFGTVKNSIEDLVQFPFAIINLDSVLIPNSVHNDSSATTVSAALAIARNLDMEVHAKGVDSQEDIDILESLGCRAARGNLFSGAIPAPEVESFVRRWNSLSMVTNPELNAVENTLALGLHSI